MQAFVGEPCLDVLFCACGMSWRWVSQHGTDNNLLSYASLYRIHQGKSQELHTLYQRLYDPSQILIHELFSGLVQSAQVLDSGANQWSGSVRADLAYRIIRLRDRVHYQCKSIGCSASYEASLVWVFNMAHSALDSGIKCC